MDQELGEGGVDEKAVSSEEYTKVLYKLGTQIVELADALDINDKPTRMKLWEEQGIEVKRTKSGLEEVELDTAKAGIDLELPGRKISNVHLFNIGSTLTDREAVRLFGNIPAHLVMLASHDLENETSYFYDFYLTESGQALRVFGVEPPQGPYENTTPVNMDELKVVRSGLETLKGKLESI